LQGQSITVNYVTSPAKDEKSTEGKDIEIRSPWLKLLGDNGALDSATALLSLMNKTHVRKNFH